MAELGAALVHLSSAVEATVRYDGLPDTASEAEILDAATSDDPELLAPFQRYTVRVQRQGQHAVLLVCDAGGTQGLLEDAGCSMPMDRSMWPSNPRAPCEFSLDTVTVCAGRELAGPR
jgi:hypothetical protein